MSSIDLSVISGAELMRDVLMRLGNPDMAPGGIVVGPTNDQQQQMGVVSIMDAGMPALDLYTPTITIRTQIRCLAPRLELADRIVRGIQQDFNGRGRIIARMASTDTRYLIHSLNITAGSSMHYDSPQVWETLLFAEVRVGTQAISYG